MRIEQTRWIDGSGWASAAPDGLGSRAQLVLTFGSPGVLKNREVLGTIRTAYPAARVFGCTTAGEICGVGVHDESLVCTAVHFEHTQVSGARVEMADAADSRDAGRRLAEALRCDDLTHVFVLSDGIQVNGSDLVAGLTAALPPHVKLTGGLSADADRFHETLVLWDEQAESGTIGAIGLHGDRVKVGFGSLGGWDCFGPERIITRSEGNVLFELDGRSALELYKNYLGEHAAGLPATGLLFPLSLRSAADATPVVRTILAVDEEQQSVTFAGDMSQGSCARLMMANFDRLIDGAAGAARTTHASLNESPPELAILISCVGRRLVLKQRVEEEVESVREVLGESTVMTGFYSYGEISPFTPEARCELHNQTMTITALSEK